MIIVLIPPFNARVFTVGSVVAAFHSAVMVADSVQVVWTFAGVRTGHVSVHVEVIKGKVHHGGDLLPPHPLVVKSVI